MRINNIFKKKKRGWNAFVEPDEIFLDSENLQQFDTQQFEGRLEKPIRKRSVYFSGIVFVVVAVLFSWRLYFLQISNGEAFFEQSEKNSLVREPLFADRGIIYDRNGKELVWNDTNTTGEPFAKRVYINESGFGHLLGYVSYPSKDKDGFYWQSEFVGKDGVEKMYNDMLHGTNGARLIERDVKGSVASEGVTDQPIHGKNVTLTIDKDIQAKLYEKMQAVGDNAHYQGGAAVMMDITNGEVLALSSYPEYDSTVLSLGDDREKIGNYFTNSKHPFLNRTVAGLYSPGSIIKPFIAMAALKEGVIDPLTQILSAGSISIPNPYDPTKATVFRDFNKNNGWVDLRNALKVSSNIYFFEVGGGYKTQKGIGIKNIQKYADIFGIGNKTGIDVPGEKDGVIPGPEWKEKVFPGDPWRIGDTYNTAIGQYGFQVTPIQMARGLSAIANYGTLVTPHVLKDDSGVSFPTQKLDFPHDDFQVVHEGMRLVAEEGTAHSFTDLPFKAAAKTGTAQVGVHNEYINSWTMTFFPYDKPRYVLVVLMEKGPTTNTIGSQMVAHDTLLWLGTNKSEYTTITP